MRLDSRAIRRGTDGDIAAFARFYLVRVDAFVPDTAGIGASEADVTWRWWGLDDLKREASSNLIPSRMAALLEPLLLGVIPASPVDASAPEGELAGPCPASHAKTWCPSLPVRGQPW